MAEQVTRDKSLGITPLGQTAAIGHALLKPASIGRSVVDEDIPVLPVPGSESTTTVGIPTTGNTKAEPENNTSVRPKQS